MSGRDDIMAAIRAGLKGAYLPGASDNHPGALPRHSTPGDVDRFQTELEALHGNVYRATDPSAATQRVIEIAYSSETDRILAWSEAEIGLPGLEDALKAAGLKWHEARPGMHASQIHRDFTIGLTGAKAGLADTGAMVVTSGRGRARYVSLVPPVHVAILSAKNIYADMAAFWAAHPDAARDASNLVFIAGPSRSADIELKLALGVHGPRELHVIITP